MKLLKVKDGLLEVDNFYLTSFFSDFAGSSNIVRDIKTKQLKLISNTQIQRKFNHDEFLIEFEKENFKTINDDEYCTLYLGNSTSKFGIKETKTDKQNKFWKILKSNNHIQAYASKDGLDYTNIGGMEFLEPLTHQGFEKNSTEDFILKNYMVYCNPYITLQNAAEGSTVQFYNNKDELIMTRKFDSNMECKIFLDSKTQGYFIFKDIDNVEYYRTELINLGYGDVYVLSPYNFEIIYHGSVVTNTNVALLQDLEELISIKNIDVKEYKNINIGTETSTNDLIELSWDGQNYKDTLTIDSISPEEIKNLFVRITKNVENHNFSVRDFQLVINE